MSDICMQESTHILYPHLMDIVKTENSLNHKKFYPYEINTFFNLYFLFFLLINYLWAIRSSKTLF
jgi:hypothetical protein